MTRSDTAGPLPVAVVIVSWNCAGFLEDCLNSLRGLSRPPREIVVVDNGSRDGSPDVVRQGFPEARLIEAGQNLGFCRANNLGIGETRAPLVLVLNPDTRLRPDFLEELLPAFDDRQVGIAAGKLLRFDEQTLDSCGQSLARSRQPLDRGYGEADRGQFESDAEVFGACGAAVLYRRAMLESIADPGGACFDETFFAFYEDLDLAWRARRAGWKAVYRHRAVGFHARGGTSRPRGLLTRVAAMLGRSPEIRYHIVKNRYLTILRNDTVGAYLGSLPWIWGRDVATIVLLLLSSPTVLRRLWRHRELFAAALEKRRLDTSRARHEVGSGISASGPDGVPSESKGAGPARGTDGSEAE
jgi:GT2 family glycosyltransferase